MASNAQPTPSRRLTDELPYPEGKFDLIWLVLVLTHLPDYAVMPRCAVCDASSSRAAW